MQKGKKFLSDLKLYSDYFKWMEDKNRYENWDDACENIIDGHRKKYHNYRKEIEPYLQSALESMKDQVVLASQRNLQYRHEQIMKHNTRMFNCTSGHIARNRVFQEIFYLALSGCGFGGGLLIPFVNNLSRIQKRTLGTKTFIIQDSIEGWSDALGVLMSSYFVDNQPFPEYAGYEVKFDYSQIREKGSFISGGFKAPGPDGLKQSLERIEQLIEKWIANEGNKIRPILAFDIICHSADAVLSGGVRRSALNMIVDPNDDEMIHAKTGNWRMENPQRGRSNNSVLLLRSEVTKEKFDYLVKLNDGANDIGFVFANSWFDMFNPCFEILKIPVLDNIDFSKIEYDEVESYVRKNKNKFGIQGCNLTEINAEKCTTKDKFLRACKDASILGTLQAGYTNFPYLGETSRKIFEREALLGVSITGWMNNPKLFNPELLEEGAKMVRDTNKEVAFLIDINQAARTTCVKPSGNASVVLGTASGIHPEHSEKYFRIMQLNKESNTAKWLEENMSFLLEESVWSSTNSDYVVFVPVENPKQGLFKKDMKGIKHLELIKLVQQHWVNAGTNPELCVYNPVNHNTSCTVIIDDKDAIVEYIWDNKDYFTAVSFISDYGDKDFNQAPFTSVLNLDELIAAYGKGAVLASGLIIDGLHYFNQNLWLACDTLLDETIPVTGTREQVLLKKYWLSRAKKFAKNYFKNDLTRMIYCLKDVHLFHKWETITRQFKEVNFGEILDRPQYKDVSDYASMACSGPNGSCEITKI
jgi:ribonucleoside-triphosphate reductase (thioredoxin)